MNVIGRLLDRYARLLGDPEVIGPAGCPIVLRWTLHGGSDHDDDKTPSRTKVWLHRFMAHADDRDAHDHPRGFLTIVLAGRYDDLARCEVPACNGDGLLTGGWMGGTSARPHPDTCSCDHGFVLRERMRAGMIRYRSPMHVHRTRVGPDGCWTFVLVGPLRRDWGFYRFGRWIPWQDYAAENPDAMRCD